MKKKRSGLQTIIFYLFVLVALILVISPVLLKFDPLRHLLNWFLFDLNTYKGDYVGLLGGMAGAGLAVSSAIYVQTRIDLVKEKDEKVASNKRKRIRANIISTYIERELKMLWGLWIWARYESPYHRYFSEKSVPFEPYTINQDHILESFLDIDTDLSESSSTTFYNVFYFAEMVNGYVEYYKSIYYDQMYLDSSTTYGQNGIQLQTEYKPSRSLHEITQILCSLIHEKKVELFFQDKNEFESWNNYYNKKSKLQKQIEEAKENVLNNMSQNPKFVTEGEDRFHLVTSRILDDWLMSGEKTEIDGDYLSKVNDILELKEKIYEIEQIYSDEKKAMIATIDLPRHSTSIDALIEELKAMGR